MSSIYDGRGGRPSESYNLSMLLMTALQFVALAALPILASKRVKRNKRRR